MLHAHLIIFFFIGYAAIVFENFLRVNKAAVALIMGVVCWLLYFGETNELISAHLLAAQIYDVAQIIFFLLAVMVIVELIDSHHGFKIITDLIHTTSKKKMLWVLMIISFFMSSVLDNLTTMIIVASLLKKMIPKRQDRWLIGSVIVVTVNAGGAWTPIGDVTTTMLWIHERITTWETIKWLFLPSVINALVAALAATVVLRNDHEKIESNLSAHQMEPGGKRVFFLGLLSLIMIPVWKATLDIPPFMGALIGLGLLWLITDILHFSYGQDRWHLRVTHVLTKIDLSGILFFLGILLAIDALSTAGLLASFANFLDRTIGDQTIIAVLIGLISSVIDNVPLVAASMGMYDLASFPVDTPLWQLIAYAAGTGGSILIIGSAAGVVFMGIEKVDFIWFFKKISWIALISYFAGLGVYWAQRVVFG